MMNMADHDAYKDMDDRDDNSGDAYGNPGDIDGRATMVPPSGFSTLHVNSDLFFTLYTNDPTLSIQMSK